VLYLLDITDKECSLNTGESSPALFERLLSSAQLVML